MRVLDMKWISVGIITSPTLIGNVIVPNDLPTLSKPQIEREPSWIREVSTLILWNKSILYKFRPEPLSIEVRLMAIPLMMVIITRGSH